MQCEDYISKEIKQVQKTLNRTIRSRECFHVWNHTYGWHRKGRAIDMNHDLSECLYLNEQGTLESFKTSRYNRINTYPIGEMKR